MKNITIHVLMYMPDFNVTDLRRSNRISTPVKTTDKHMV